MSRKQILLLDASPDMAESLTMLFAMSGFRTIVASSLQKVSLDGIDAIMVEIDNLIELPAVKRVLDRKPKGCPAIAISGHSNDRFQQELTGAGFTHFLVKGDSVSWLAEVIGETPATPAPMRAEDLANQFSTMDDVSEMLLVIEQKNGRTWRGRNIDRWRYEMVPWGVRFLHLAANMLPDEAVVSLALPAFLRNTVGVRYCDDRFPTIVLMLNTETLSHSVRC